MRAIIRRHIASILASLIPHIQINNGGPFYKGERYVLPTKVSWLYLLYLQAMIVVLCWKNLLVYRQYWDGQRSHLTYEMTPEAISLREEFFPTQKAPNKDEGKNIFNDPHTPGVSTTIHVLKEDKT